jgi:hypothetical protein
VGMGSNPRAAPLNGGQFTGGEFTPGE